RINYRKNNATPPATREDRGIREKTNYRMVTGASLNNRPAKEARPRYSSHPAMQSSGKTIYLGRIPVELA
ncbi:MAG: hypothetical protein ACLQJ0_11765, partial [Steroidobacteraceae bacterium]